MAAHRLHISRGARHHFYPPEALSLSLWETGPLVYDYNLNQDRRRILQLQNGSRHNLIARGPFSILNMAYYKT